VNRRIPIGLLLFILWNWSTPRSAIALTGQPGRRYDMNIKRLLETLVLGLGLTLALLAGLQMAHASPAAVTRYVTAGGNDGGGTSSCTPSSLPCRTVQQAMNVATDGDEIRVATGVYTGVQAHTGVTQVVYINKTVILRGGYTTTNWTTSYPLTQPTTLDAGGQGRVVYITGDISPTLDGFIIAHGSATGLRANCLPNDADGCGGGIFVIDAHPIVVNNTITNNIAAVTTANPTYTTGYGGGLYMNGAVRAIISGNLIISNVGSMAYCGAGGGIYLYPYANTLNGAQVQFNQVLSNTATTTNYGCAWGGGIHGGPDDVLIQGNVIAGNRANGYGGGQGAGLYQWFGSATYLNNLVRGNLGGVSSQAVYLGHSRSHFEGNRVMDNATSQGIQMSISEGEGPTLVNNVVARSGDETLVATGYAGNPLTATLFHNTLIGFGTGYGVYVETGYVTLFLTNTIVASHTWGITNTVPASSTVLADHTLFWANTHNGIRGVNPADGDPAFAADGYHLGPGSAAYNRGVDANVTTDIDGDPRPDSCSPDIGADELITGLTCRRIYLPIVMK
jgi:hypothetical protein